MSLTTVDGSLISSGAITLTTQVTGTLPEANGGTGTTVGYCGFKNKIINGQMQIDQRNAGASYTPVQNGYSLDRWVCQVSQANKFTIQQNAGSVTPPVGFKNYLGVTSSSSYSIGATDYFTLEQRIEGLNLSDLGWGTANAKTITLSFQVYSSLTGTFGGSLFNSAANRSYPFTYTISSANTWTSISLTIAGDTTGTWLTTNGIGLNVGLSLGVGSTYSGTAGAWTATGYNSSTGATSVVGTNGATFYITGVQLEKGSTATSFDYRPYGTELALCQRYYEKSYNIDVVPATNTLIGWFVVPPYTPSNDLSVLPCIFQVTKRTAPSISLYTSSGTIDRVDIVNTSVTTSVTTTARSIGTRGFGSWLAAGTTGTPSSNLTGYHFVASAEL